MDRSDCTDFEGLCLIGGGNLQGFEGDSVASQFGRQMHSGLLPLLAWHVGIPPGGAMGGLGIGSVGRSRKEGEGRPRLNVFPR
jgi:hypothetical protein